jgi:hypothetical protein
LHYGKDSDARKCHNKVEIPFEQQEAASLPDNSAMALHRLNSLCKGLAADKTFHRKYTEYMNKLILLVHAEQESIEKPAVVWYLSHYAVLNNNKPEKFIIIFDRSARFNGYALNDCDL